MRDTTTLQRWVTPELAGDVGPRKPPIWADHALAEEQFDDVAGPITRAGIKHGLTLFLPARVVSGRVLVFLFFASWNAEPQR